MRLCVVTGNGCGNSNRPVDELFNRNGDVKSPNVLYWDGSLDVMGSLIGDRHRDRSLNRNSHMILNVSIVSSFIWENLLVFSEALNRNRDSLFNYVCSSKGGCESVLNWMSIIASIHDTIGSI
jgi:hypothetical protein